jgi:hypothetical protein
MNSPNTPTLLEAARAVERHYLSGRLTVEGDDVSMLAFSEFRAAIAAEEERERNRVLLAAVQGAIGGTR